MKKALTSLILGFASVAAASAATITFSNFDTGFNNVTPFVDSSDTLVTTTGTAQLGFFTDDVAVAAGDFSSFTAFGSAASFADSGAFGLDGLFIGSASQGISTGDAFDGQNIYTFINFGSESLVAKSATTFAPDAPNFTATILLDRSSNYIFGGSDGPDVDLGGGPLVSLRLSPVPEPSAFAFISGALALTWVMVRRRA